MSANLKPIAWIRRQPRWRLALMGLVVMAVLFFALRGSGTLQNNSATFEARRGPLDITVLEGGSVQALESQEVKCEVRVGYQGVKILKIVEEGYHVTEEDIAEGKVLVELDSSEIEKQIAQQEIQYQSADAALTEAQQNYEIQINQNLSDLKAAEQKVRFAQMDFDKFLGETLAQQIAQELQLERQLAEAMTMPALERGTLVARTPEAGPGPETLMTALNQSGDAPVVMQAEMLVVPELQVSGPGVAVPAATQPAMVEQVEVPEERVQNGGIESPMVDFAKYTTVEALGDGEAKQKLRKFEDDLQVAQKELGQAKATLEGTRRLYERGFVTRIDLDRDEIAHENTRLKVQTADTARDLFLRYDLIKSAEESLSAYAEAVRELVRARKAAVSKLAQAEARLRSADGQFKVQSRQRAELREQLEKCIIRATKPGLVVYGGGRDQGFYYGGEERIREGATVRERQAIITIPDMTRMSIEVRIHETYIKKVKAGQKARVTVDAFADRVLEGAVTKVGVLPDSENRWMNPDLKVYRTTITIDGTHDWLKPGMSAKAEVLVDRLEDVVYVPVQAVSPSDSRRVCHVVQGGVIELREVEVGDFNDEFIEIRSGLKEGEKVVLRPPRAAESPDSGTPAVPGEEGAPVETAAGPVGNA
jgi:HlyD family secretion protein